MNMTTCEIPWSPKFVAENAGLARDIVIADTGTVQITDDEYAYIMRAVAVPQSMMGRISFDGYRRMWLIQHATD